MRGLLALLGFLILSGCAGAGASTRGADPPRPGWVDQPPAPAAGVLRGVGVVDGPGQRDAAVERARAEVLAQIAISIDAERTQDDRSSESQTSAGLRSASFSSEARNRIRTRVGAADVPGMQIEQVWSSSTETAALVALDRAAWAAALRLRLGEQDAELAAIPLPEAGRLAARIRHFQQVAPLIEARAETARRLRVADPGARVPPAPLDPIALRAELAQAASAWPVFLTGGAEAAELLGPLAERLARLGLPVVPERARAKLVLHVGNRTAVRVQNGDHRVDGNLDGLLTAADGRRLAGFSLEDRASGTMLEDARRRLRDRQAEHIAEHVAAHLLDWLANLEP